MKNLYWLLFAMVATTAMAQETKKRPLVSVEEAGEITTVKIPGIQIMVDEGNDTITSITLGNKQLDVVETDNRTELSVVRLPRTQFKGHLTGVTLAFNWYVNANFNTDFGSDNDFLNQNRGKSMSFGIYPLQYSIGLQKHKNTIGLVVGAGWTVHNYRFSHSLVWRKTQEGITSGVPTEMELLKNKVTISYINLPLLFEFQIPTRNDQNRFIFDAGAFVGFKIGSHTKYIYSENGSKNKEKDRPDLNINPVQYGALVQAGTRHAKLFATYNFSTLFARHKGPEVYPIQVGLSLITF